MILEDKHCYLEVCSDFIWLLLWYLPWGKHEVLWTVLRANDVICSSLVLDS